MMGRSLLFGENLRKYLNDNQLEAVTSGHHHVLVVAGPGSGKTRVIIYRILFLIEQMQVPPFKILAMTFTNKAAGEIKRRISLHIGEMADKIWMGTFHSICTRILRIYKNDAGLENGFTIISEDEQIKIIKTILSMHFPGFKAMGPSAIRLKIEKVKRSWPMVTRNTGKFNSGEEEFWNIFSLYNEWLKEHHLLDFSDLITRTVEFLEDKSEIRRILSERFQHVLVDEFQDTDPLQYRLVRLFSERHGNLFVVGDDDQSIYRWRGATVENILNFKKDYPDCSVVKLEKNYRSTSNILALASEVIKENRYRTNKVLWTDAPPGAPVKFIESDTEKDEARRIVREIQNFAASGGKYGECAVIYRIHAQSRAIEEALIENNVPYKIIGGIRFYDRMEIKDLLSYLRLACNNNDDLSFSRILNVPPRQLGESVLGRLEKLAYDRKLSLFQAAHIAIEEKILPRSKLLALSKLIEVILHAAKMSEEGNCPSKILKEIMEEISYQEYIMDNYSDTSETRIQNIQELVSHFESIEAEEEKIDLFQLLDRITLYTSSDFIDSTENRVVLMTAHSAKGLEFDFVCVAGVENGLFPYKSWNEYMLDEHERLKEEEEERRLLYVAMTRARKHLVLTCARSRSAMKGRGGYREISPFIEFAVDSLLLKEDSPEIRRKKERKLEESASEKVQMQETDCQNIIKIGDKVRHKKFGTGRVVSITRGPLNKITVKFQNGEVKQIVETFLERN